MVTVLVTVGYGFRDFSDFFGGYGFVVMFLRFLVIFLEVTVLVTVLVTVFNFLLWICIVLIFVFA